MDYFIVCYSEWGYYRDEISNNCTLNQEYGPQGDCLTGYVTWRANINIKFSFNSKMCKYVRK